MTLALFAVAAMAVQYLSCLLACRAICSKDAWRQTPQISSCADAVTLVRPLCGLEPFSRRTIAASFAQDYPHYEVLFCVASAEDPVVPLAKEAIAAHPRVRARLLVGDDRISGNPKLNNMARACGTRATHGLSFATATFRCRRPIFGKSSEHSDRGQAPFPPPRSARRRSDFLRKWNAACSTRSRRASSMRSLL